MESPAQQSQARGNGPPRKKVAAACRQCRRRKVKCSGLNPCYNCTSRRQTCIFDEVERRVVISARHLFDLERRATVSSLESAGVSTSRNINPPEGHEDVSELSPFVRTPSRATDQHIDVGTHGNGSSDPRPGDNRLSQRHTSTDQDLEGYHENSSISRFAGDLRRILSLEVNHPVDARIVEPAPYLDLQPNTVAAFTKLESLPNHAYVHHLAGVADFHLNAVSYAFDYSAFTNQLHQIISNPLSKTLTIWQVNTLAIIAVGKLFLEKGATEQGPPGIQEFLQCIASLPSAIELTRDPKAAMEMLCVLAFYAHFVDMHTAAYLYTGQALRLAQSKGLEPSSVLSDESPSAAEEGSRQIWLTLRTLDQRLAANLKLAPNWPGAGAYYETFSLGNSPCSGFTFRLRANYAIATTLTRVMEVLSRYRGENLMSDSFGNEMSQQLSTLQEIDCAIRSSEPLCSGPSLATISRSSATLQLLISHCVLVGVQPLLIHMAASSTGRSDETYLPWVLSASLREILKTCITAATLSNSILKALGDQGLLETFAYLDSEMAFLSTGSLVLGNIINPGLQSPELVSLGCEVLAYMKRQGNLRAGALEAELQNYSGSACSAGAPRRKIAPPLFEEPVFPLENAEALNEARSTIFTIPTVPQLDHSAGRPQIAFPELADQCRDGQGSALVPEPTDSDPMVANQLTMAHGIVLPDRSEGLLLDSFGTWETSMDLCEADSDWLDFM